jgi:GNAT superfamily N-acetyltransferase
VRIAHLSDNIVLTFGYSLEYQGRGAFIDEFFVQASHRHRGWGKITLQHAEKAARELNIRALHLEITRENGRA